MKNLNDFTGHLWPLLSDDERAAFTQYAQQQLGFETLDERKSDRLDFHDVSVVSLREALACAFRAGALSVNRPRRKKTNAIAEPISPVSDCQPQE